MTDKSKLAEQRVRGDRARALAEDPLIKEFFDQAEDEALKTWKESLIDEKDVREDAWRLYRVVQRLRAAFTKSIAEGTHAGKELKRLADEATTKAKPEEKT